MSIYRYGAKVEVIGAEYKNISKTNMLHAKVRLLELYDDGSGKVGDVLELPFNQLTVDGGLIEFATACERFTQLKEKELDMKTTIDSIKTKSLSELTGMYNTLVPPSKQIKRFSDRESAVARLTKELSGSTVKKMASSKASPKVQGKLNGEKKISVDVKSTPTGFTLVGKKSALAGKYLYKKVDKNPRREGTHGWASWNCLKNGMTYEQFIAAKGGNKHLMWDIEHEFVEVRSKPKA